MLQWGDQKIRSSAIELGRSLKKGKIATDHGFLDFFNHKTMVCPYFTEAKAPGG